MPDKIVLNNGKREHDGAAVHVQAALLNTGRRQNRTNTGTMFVVPGHADAPVLHACQVCYDNLCLHRWEVLHNSPALTGMSGQELYGDVKLKIL